MRTNKYRTTLFGEPINFNKFYDVAYGKYDTEHTPIAYAIESNDLELLELALKSGVNPNSYCVKYMEREETTPLEFLFEKMDNSGCITAVDYKMIKLLIKAGSVTENILSEYIDSDMKELFNIVIKHIEGEVWNCWGCNKSTKNRTRLPCIHCDKCKIVVTWCNDCSARRFENSIKNRVLFFGDGGDVCPKN